MKYRILKSFKGSQDGRFAEDFTEGMECELSDYLVSCVPSDWISPVGKLSMHAAEVDEKTVEIDNKAIITDSPKRKAK